MEAPFDGLLKNNNTKKKHENIFENWLRPNFLKNGGLENLGQPPLCPPGPYAPLTKLKRRALLQKITSFLPFRVRNKYIPFLN